MNLGERGAENTTSGAEGTLRTKTNQGTKE